MAENEFLIEEHVVKTEDHYHLKLFRIVGKYGEKERNEGDFKSFDQKVSKPPVLF